MFPVGVYRHPPRHRRYGSLRVLCVNLRAIGVKFEIFTAWLSPLGLHRFLLLCCIKNGALVPVWHSLLSACASFECSLGQDEGEMAAERPPAGGLLRFA